ncbi:MAG: HAMP domain-containing histidine kinase, partial [Bacteroidia bacterium]|nr:HAMP domain-containing histidine kinase [Bacteroidia bacterium]
IDANLYDSTGHLLASSIEDIYNQGLSAPLMNPKAIEVLKLQKTSQLVNAEKIRDLTFTSAYLPLVNDKRDVIAYLNLPYYSRQNELSNEISSYTVNFVNLYLFLILFAIGLAYVVSQRISKPLQIIREQMSKTGLRTNELIEWKQNDEIGRLVKQYNKMVIQLGDSAQKLSESEREGAWKEMARQVAHEIKNPLTPMKLNIQHLQRAWSDKNERLEDTFKRVTGVLIEQIDSLSKLATEFSSFAKMPVNNFENCNLSNSLLSTITLFEKSENVDFQYDDTLPEIMVYADREQLGRVFNNVIKNAIQAIPEDRKGSVKIRVESDSETVRVEIQDNGRGIREEDRPNIFVPNFSTKNSGMGLGLAITRKMLEAANGKIWFESVEGVGTTFYLQWPIVTV